MAKRALHVEKSLDSERTLYRYISLSQFIAFVETGTTYLSKILHWEDTWEVPTSRVPLLSTDDELEYPLWSISEDMFGQSWSLLGESDALWRIYSRDKEGLMIHTSVEKFGMIEELKYGMLAPVIYYEELRTGLELLKGNHDYITPFSNAFLKRKAFEHEKEVRLVTLNDERCIGNRYRNPSIIYLKLDPIIFIEGITIDPRASDWYVQALKSYCKRSGFSFVLTRSTLYSTDVFETTGLVQKWVPVKPEEDQESESAPSA